MCQTNYADRRSVRLGLTMAAPSQPFLGASSIARFGGITPAFALPPSLPSPPQTRAVVDELEVAEAGAMVDNVVGAGGGGDGKIVSILIYLEFHSVAQVRKYMAKYNLLFGFSMIKENFEIM